MNKEKHQLFSFRHGHEQSKPIQLESMDRELRNGLWNIFLHYFKDAVVDFGTRKIAHRMFGFIWVNFQKSPADEYKKWHATENKEFVKVIIQKQDWYHVFNLIEFVINAWPDFSPAFDRQNISADDFIGACNAMLKQENSAYRIVRGCIVEITSEEEIKSIETATTTPYQGANDHIGKALFLCSRPENPDYENSIKESISAVESIVTVLTGKKRFSDGVRDLKNHGIKLHSQHEAALINLYRFTSDAGAIRHGSKDGELLTINQNTARLMLITCSAFVNYIISQQR